MRHLETDLRRVLGVARGVVQVPEAKGAEGVTQPGQAVVDGHELAVSLLQQAPEREVLVEEVVESVGRLLSRSPRSEGGRRARGTRTLGT